MQPKLWLKFHFPRIYEGIKALSPSTQRRKEALAGKDPQEVFTAIYKANDWQDAESRSGHGSTLANTARLRAELPRVLAALQTNIVLDAPCGDFNWMQHVDFSAFEQYIGADIVPDLITKLAAQYGSPRRSFRLLNIITDPLPAADVFFCRDCLLHLSFKDIAGVFDNFRKSPCRHLITSNYPAVKLNVDILTGEVRPLNLCLPPFNLPPPIQTMDDSGNEGLNRLMGVWRRDQV